MLECFRHVLRVELKFFLIYTHFMNRVLTLISMVNWELLSICTWENYLLGWIDDIHTEMRLNCHLSTEKMCHCCRVLLFLFISQIPYCLCCSEIAKQVDVKEGLQAN
jgi:hypothetical protein